jgi:hypothetical protein
VDVVIVYGYDKKRKYKKVEIIKSYSVKINSAIKMDNQSLKYRLKYINPTIGRISGIHSRFATKKAPKGSSKGVLTINTLQINESTLK